HTSTHHSHASHASTHHLAPPHASSGAAAHTTSAASSASSGTSKSLFQNLCGRHGLWQFDGNGLVRLVLDEHISFEGTFGNHRRRDRSLFHAVKQLDYGSRRIVREFLQRSLLRSSRQARRDDRSRAQGHHSRPDDPTHVEGGY